MNWLPSMVSGSGLRRSTQAQFGGYMHTAGCGEGELWDMENLSGDKSPLLSPRPPRYLLRRLQKPNGLYARDGLCWVDGTGFYADGERKGSVADSPKRFASLGDYLLILPDKAYYHRKTGEFGSLEALWTGTATFGDGTYGGVPAKRNTIKTTGTPFPFRAGDAVEITGCAKEENNKTPILQEVSEDGKELRFLENVFAEGSWTGTVTLKRSVPEMDFLCENENRLWGCKGSTIYASKLGDPFNWNVNSGLATDSFAVEVGSAGKFTGCCAFLGYPVFFKEDQIYKVYGNKPSNFQVMGSASLGVEEGSGESLAVAGERLFYLSRTGVMSYTGGMPQELSASFGELRYRNAVGGSDGTKYYVSMEDGAGKWSLFVYDTRTGLWHREDSVHARAFGWDGELYFLDDAGGLWLGGTPREVPEGAQEEEAVESMAEFGDFTEGSPDKKGVGKLLLRITVEEGAEVRAFLQFDSDTEWQELSRIQADKKRSVLVPILPRRADHFRLRLSGRGRWALFSLTREYYSGSAL